MLSKRKCRMLCAGIVSVVFAILTAFGQSNQQQPGTGKDVTAQSRLAASSAVPTQVPRSRSAYVSAQRSVREEKFYRSVWGIDKLLVREAASGALLRFSYQVTDANKAKMLNDEKATPYLIDEATGVVLQIPTMPKVGKLRQTANPADGREYWMVFSNKGVVKPGSRVSVVIGNFRANRLVVQ